MLWPKINSYKEFDNEKKFLRLENSPPPTPPPHNFCNGPSQKTAVCKDLTETGSLWHPGTLLPQSGHRKLETRKPLDKTSLIHKMAAEASSVVTSKAPGTPCFRASYPKEKFSALCIFRIQR